MPMILYLERVCFKRMCYNWVETMRGNRNETVIGLIREASRK